MSARTTFLAKLIGLSLLAIAVGMLVNRASMAGTISLSFFVPAFVLTYGMIALFAGLAMVIAHNVWTDGLLPLVVTVIGWLALIRGVFLLWFPPSTILNVLAFSRFAEFFSLYTALVFILGAYLTYAGFRATTRSV